MALLGVLGLLAAFSCFAQTKKPEDTASSLSAGLERMPESLEARFALSAAPPHLRDAATVYLLDPAKGYVLNRKGSNGVSCIVVRSDWQWTNHPFRDDIFWAVCYDAEGSKTLLQDYLAAAELRAPGWTRSKRTRKSPSGLALPRILIRLVWEFPTCWHRSCAAFPALAP